MCVCSSFFIPVSFCGFLKRSPLALSPQCLILHNGINWVSRDRQSSWGKTGHKPELSIFCATVIIKKVSINQKTTLPKIVLRCTTASNHDCSSPLTDSWKKLTLVRSIIVGLTFGSAPRYRHLLYNWVQRKPPLYFSQQQSEGECFEQYHCGKVKPCDLLMYS